jgi:hypothetical protein
MNENDNTQNQPMEFKILETKPSGFTGTGWFHDDAKLGSERELESILNRLGSEGWDIVQIINGPKPSIFLRRKAR